MSFETSGPAGSICESDSLRPRRIVRQAAVHKTFFSIFMVAEPVKKLNWGARIRNRAENGG
jgi:hypothetical protein